ncbi:MAG: hypothetical protein M3340_15745 [Actinomycetota bacterium]|nr:hypothetical protein [Actinomycetota bacterium]
MRLRDQSGSALVIAVIVTGLMMSLGLAGFAYVDGQSRQAADERIRESAFNHDDGVLTSQAFVVSQLWPAAASTAYPDCYWNGSVLSASGASANTARCPDPTVVARSFTARDYATGVQWSTIVRDNGGTSVDYYDDATTPTQPAWDANGDGEVWIRAITALRGTRRTVVERIRIDRLTVTLPKNVLTAGSFQVTTGGPKPFISLNGSTLGLRCSSASSSGCYVTTKPGQVKGPGSTSFNWPGTHQIPPSDLDRLRQTAMANGTYYTGCPTSPVGTIVFVESGNCSYNGNGNWNSAAAPGMFILVNGTLTWRGNPTYYGTVYLYNAQNATCPLFDAGGSSTIQGAIFIDGPGCFQVGGNTRVIYDANAIRSINYYSSISKVRNSFRELN